MNLEYSPEEMRSMAEAVVTRCIDHIATLERQPSCGDVDAEALCRAMREDAPERGTTLEAILDPLFRDWVPRSFTAPGPGYLAYIPGGGLFPAAGAGRAQEDQAANLIDRFSSGCRHITGDFERAADDVERERREPCVRQVTGNWSAGVDRVPLGAAGPYRTPRCRISARCATLHFSLDMRSRLQSRR